MDVVAEIERLYYNATPATIQRDLNRAVELLKALPTEDDRERAAVFMDGLSQMRSEWAEARRGSRARTGKPSASKKRAR